MKIKLSSFCNVCFEETGQAREEYSNYVLKNNMHIIELEINNQNIYDLKCSKGHYISTIELQNEKFELLFDRAAMALSDGYTKEAVSTLSSSLESFIEFYFKVIVIRKNIKIEEFIKIWKLISRQSERQLGAFYMLQLIEYGETKFTLDEKRVKFRNNVTHQGYIPSSKEAIEYGEYIINFIFSVLNYLKENDLESLNKVQTTDFSESKDKSSIMQNRFIGNIRTIIDLRSIENQNFGKVSFETSVKKISKDLFYSDFYIKSL